MFGYITETQHNHSTRCIFISRKPTKPNTSYTTSLHISFFHFHNIALLLSGQNEQWAARSKPYFSIEHLEQPLNWTRHYVQRFRTWRQHDMDIWPTARVLSYHTTLRPKPTWSIFDEYPQAQCNIHRISSVLYISS